MPGPQLGKRGLGVGKGIVLTVLPAFAFQHFVDAQYGFGLAARLVPGADEQDFRLGFDGVLRIEPPKNTRFELDIGSTAGVGWHELSALNFDDLAAGPVTFEVLLTDGPNQSVTAGEMTRLKLGWQATGNLTLTAMASYQALSGPDHGSGGGGEAMWRF